MANIDQNEEAIVIIGSGAGGGTLAYELTAKGLPVVVLEAGPYLRNEDYLNRLFRIEGVENYPTGVGVS
ncbi:NAD(P)-binding protein [Brevibacterium sp. 50QC2O2]|uniref:NAD(P)-binding protein n=1 Tax=Brevibacterium sp. 50QC2O2 TaxID=2968459 RepID=UPI003593B85A